MSKIQISRRNTLLGISAATLASGLGAYAASADTRSLKAIAGPKGIEIGSIHKTNMPQDELKLLVKHCNVLTPENGMKLSWLYPKKLRPDKMNLKMLKSACGNYKKIEQEKLECFHAADMAYEFAEANKMATHIHTVYWPKHPLPQWLIDLHGSVENAYREHIRKLIKRYPKAVSWDILNEVFKKGEDLSRSKGWRSLAPDPQIGPDPKAKLEFFAFLIITLREELKKAGRTARIVFNEDGLSGEDFNFETKRMAVLELAAKLEQLEAPLDAVGIQGHLSARYGTDNDAIVKFIQDLELQVHISELDFNSNSWEGTGAYPDGAHKVLVKEYLTAVLAEPNVKRLSFWGLSDANSYLVTEGESTREQKPTLFDSSYKKKPVFDGVVQALEAAPVRT